MLDTGNIHDMDAQRPVVLYEVQLRRQPAVINFSLPYLDLHFIHAGIT